jgi:transposase-like protein
MGKRRKFTPELKAKVALSVLTGAKTPAQVCREQQLKPELVTRWKQELVREASTVFSRDQQRSEEQEKIAELERLVGWLGGFSMILPTSKKVSRLLGLDENANGS